MNLGLKGRQAIVCGASKGLGYGCAAALAEADADVTVVARTQSTLDEAVAQLRELGGGEVQGVAADVTTEAGRAAVLSACPRPHVLITNAGGPPPGDFREWGRDEWLAALDANMLAPIEMIKATVDHMAEAGFGRIVNITSHMVKEAVGLLGLSMLAREVWMRRASISRAWSWPMMRCFMMLARTRLCGPVEGLSGFCH